ncbi:unnamed protein product [Mytilus coruscus]|uniref:Ig-like domain-containing protein n=1 Tax=Mytilus coruscus TaxID=42192 RepID=A0A6J8BS41_MYTCO|nr:unnamed protein product [Mytilus coruscus]
MKNLTTSNTGFYWLDYWNPKPALMLNITNRSCPTAPIKQVCAIAGSSPILTFIFNWPVYQSNKGFYFIKSKSQRVINFTIHAIVHIYNVTSEDEGYYENQLFHKSNTRLQVAKLLFSNQTDLQTILGQEGEVMNINCSSDTKQYITALKIESNGTVKAIGDNQTVSFSFIPDRTDHMTIYKCLDIIHSSIMIEVELYIRYAPTIAIRYKNGTIECDCDGVPSIYSVYRLDQISKYGELVRSVYLNNETFTFHTDPFPYQRNGRYMCAVSNGIPDTNGEVLQTWSTNVNYEGPPVFAKENRYVKIGRMGQSSITLSFHVYSCPDVEEIFLEKLGLIRGKKRKINRYVLKPTVLYNEFDSKAGIQGYDILIESEELDIDDFQAYCITVKNRLGESEYHFEIIKKEELVNIQAKRTQFVTLCIVGAVLFGSIIVHVGFCVNHIRTRVPRHVNVHEDHNYHTYDEIGTISYRAVSNFRSSDTNHTEGQASGISTGVNLQTTADDTPVLSVDFPDDDLSHRDVTEVQVQNMSISSDDTILSNLDLTLTPSTVIRSMQNMVNSSHTNERTNNETSSDEKSETSDDSDSGSSNNVLVGNVGDGYENPYQSVLQDHLESQPYTEIIRERHNSNSSTESDQSKEQRIGTGSTKKADYINLQF